MGVGGWGDTDPAWPTRHDPIDGVKLSASDLAGLVSWGVQNLEPTVVPRHRAVRASVLDKNPQLGGRLYDDGADAGSSP